MAVLLKGAPVAAAINGRTAAAAEALRRRGIAPTLAILRVGERPDNVSYENGAVKRCAAVGVDVRRVTLPEDVSQAELLASLDALNADRGIHGILLLRPLPDGLDGEAARRAIDPAKDVDGVSDLALARVFTGSGAGFAPCTAQAVMEILDYYKIPVDGKNAMVVGRSLVVGRPAAMLLMERGATVTICHSRTRDLASITRRADILITAAGQAELFGADYLSPGQVIVDVGIHVDAGTGRLCGDVAFAQAEPLAAAVTPVPGGVGAVTIAILVSHVVQAAENAV